MPCGVPGENGQTAAPLVAEETRRVIVNVIGPRAYTETLVWVTLLNPRSAAQTFARVWCILDICAFGEINLFSLRSQKCKIYVGLLFLCFIFIYV
jgi:hypothetical protein